MEEENPTEADESSPLSRDRIESSDQDQQDVIGDLSSSDEENADDESVEEMEKDDFAQEVSSEEKVFLSHSESLKKLLVKEANNFLTGWTIDDTMGLLIQLTKHSHEQRGIDLVAKNFRNTSVDEISQSIEAFKKLNKLADQNRYQFDATTSRSDEKKNDSILYPDWNAFFTKAKRSRGISDESSDALGKFLSECACNSSVQEFDGLPDYMEIYTHLASLTTGYALKGLKGANAAIILDIFSQLERDVDSMPQMTNFFKKMFEDVQRLPNDDFKLADDLKCENAGDVMNLLDFPIDVAEKLGLPSSLPPESQN